MPLISEKRGASLETFPNNRQPQDDVHNIRLLSESVIIMKRAGQITLPVESPPWKPPRVPASLQRRPVLRLLSFFSWLAAAILVAFSHTLNGGNASAMAKRPDTHNSV
ncbi:hypothetical protein, unlikely [Trypanosoma brucei gambiense DAL972]|uniref:Uncharacterized protein n=1 Tax=Trypanosoma brucei gambiense (strain MHOM/CI/86/DAL972) TaxID=679716 RepID=C9ZKC2_TRYB9|nr:hypothetical protein, unlikely [Trypanosoma brucei gambiense DAL972]CBH09886.1 hypothetical protein, unlikely [Trypanosoma brucei gambiense DAL972]|eukprot:XP_011772179.1 hypothetical protein, unlikely [Trypanosoma brucei gambiense DAL972]